MLYSVDLWMLHKAKALKKFLDRVRLLKNNRLNCDLHLIFFGNGQLILEAFYAK